MQFFIVNNFIVNIPPAYYIILTLMNLEIGEHSSLFNY